MDYNQFMVAMDRTNPSEIQISANFLRELQQLEKSSVFSGFEVLRFLLGTIHSNLGRTSACSYLYFAGEGSFDPHSRQAIGENWKPIPGSQPRPDGLGERALKLGRAVFSDEAGAPGVNPMAAVNGVRFSGVWPLIAGEQKLAVIYVESYSDQRLSDEERDWVNILVQITVPFLQRALQNSAHDQEKTTNESELARLRQANINISSGPRLDEMLKSTLLSAMELTNAKYGILRLMDPTGCKLVPQISAGLGQGQVVAEFLPVPGKSISAWVVTNRRAAQIADMRQPPWDTMYSPLANCIHSQSQLTVPMFNPNGMVEGVINLESLDFAAFDDEANQLLQSLAAQAMISIAESRLLDAITEINAALLSENERDGFARIIKAISDLSGANFCSIWTIRDNQCRLAYASDESLKFADFPLESSLQALAIDSQNPLWIEGDILDLFRRRATLEVGDEIQKGWIFPLFNQITGEYDHVLSVYFAGNRLEKGENNQWVLKVLTILSHYVSLAFLGFERKRLLVEARESQAAAELFAYMGDISTNLLHQLNNKIGIIPLKVQSIRARYPGLLENEAYINRHLNDIETSASEAMQRVRQNLDNLHDESFGIVEVSPCLLRAVEKAQLPETIRVRYSGLEPSVSIRGSERALELIFLNLIDNARQAMENRGSLEFRLAHSQNRIEIVVRDSGPGVAPQKKETIFQFGDPAGRKPANLGFGLWWVKTQLTRMGGSIALLDEGKGAAFLIRIPLAEGNL